MDRVALYIIHDRAIDEEVNDVLVESGLDHYTKWKDVVGSGTHDPHLGDHVWPGLNNVTMTIINSDKKEVLIENLKELQKKFPSVSLRAFITPVIDMI
jgi:hypothetical protein